MSKSVIFEYAVIYHGATIDKDTKETSPGEIIVKPTTILAKDAGQATLLAARAIPEKYLAKLDRIEVAVRPF